MKVHSVTDGGERFIVIGPDGDDTWLSESKARELRDDLTRELGDEPRAVTCEHRPFEYASPYGPRPDTVPCRVCRVELRPEDEWVTTMGGTSVVTCERENCKSYVAESLRATSGQSDLTACEEQRDVYRDRCQHLSAVAQKLEVKYLASESARADLEVTVSSLQSALRSLIARIRSAGGYATPEEQDVLREAEWVAGGDPGGWPGWVRQ